MSKDIRLAIGFLDHPKTIKLRRKLGFGGVECLLRLWFFAAQYKHDGKLIDLTEEDIEIAAQWNGEPGVFVQTLVDLRWLDVCGNAPGNAVSNPSSNADSNPPACYELHSWEDNNGYVAHAKARSDRAKTAASARWGDKTRKSQQTEKLMDKDSHATSNANRNACCNAPNPSPSPNPTPNPKKSPPSPPTQEPDSQKPSPQQQTPRPEGKFLKKPKPVKKTAETVCQNVEGLFTG
ncbi:MAG: hypothetical protein V1793_15180, partial [Pseudomonadota bacterium]